MRSDALVEKMIIVDKIQHMRWITEILEATVKYLQELCTVARGRRVGELLPVESPGVGCYFMEHNILQGSVKIL